MFQSTPMPPAVSRTASASASIASLSLIALEARVSDILSAMPIWVSRDGSSRTRARRRGTCLGTAGGSCSSNAWARTSTGRGTRRRPRERAQGRAGAPRAVAPTPRERPRTKDDPGLRSRWGPFQRASSRRMTTLPWPPGAVRLVDGGWWDRLRRVDHRITDALLAAWHGAGRRGGVRVPGAFARRAAGGERIHAGGRLTQLPPAGDWQPGYRGFAYRYAFWPMRREGDDATSTTRPSSAIPVRSSERVASRSGMYSTTIV